MCARICVVYTVCICICQSMYMHGYISEHLKKKAESTAGFFLDCAPIYLLFVTFEIII